VRSFIEAYNQFASIAALAEDQRSGLGLIALINAAACAAAIDDFHCVINLIEPMYERNSVLGHPLWNLALAYAKTGRVVDAIKAMQAWASRAAASEKIRGWLVAAALAVKSGDHALAKDLLAQAARTNEQLVLELLGPVSAVTQSSLSAPPVTKSDQALSDAEASRLLQVIQPKKPERRPELALALSTDEMENFSAAIEATAEGRPWKRWRCCGRSNRNTPSSAICRWRLPLRNYLQVTRPKPEGFFSV
jgi:hypothetical protein